MLKKTEELKLNTLVLYATKYGATAEIAKRIANRMSGAIIHDLKQKGIPPLDDFDIVIIGSSVYAGMIRKEAKTYLTQYADVLQKKKTGFFISGMDANQEKTYFEKNFPPELLQNAVVAVFLGGIFDPKKAGLMERLIMRVVAKNADFAYTIDDSKIEQFTKAMKL